MPNTETDILSACMCVCVCIDLSHSNEVVDHNSVRSIKKIQSSSFFDSTKFTKIEIVSTVFPILYCVCISVGCSFLSIYVKVFHTLNELVQHNNVRDGCLMFIYLHLPELFGCFELVSTIYRSLYQ